MIIRNAITEDREGVADVLMQSYNIESAEEGMEVFSNEKKKGSNFIVAEQDGKVVGIASWAIKGLPKHQLAELDRIAVVPECRGKGIARKIFSMLIEEANKFYKEKNKKLRKLYLCTHADNLRAQAFYIKLGFRHEATLKDHYYPGKDEMVFSMFF